MEPITSPAPIMRRPIDMNLIQQAGEPGTAPRVAVYETLALMAHDLTYERYGRGPHVYDNLGFTGAVVKALRVNCLADDTPLDDLATYTGFGPPLTPLADLFRRWGLDPTCERPVPGDIVIWGAATVLTGIMVTPTQLACFTPQGAEFVTLLVACEIIPYRLRP